MPPATPPSSSPPLGRANERSALWGLAAQRRQPNGRWEIYFRWRRIFLALIVCVAIGYATLASAAYLWFRYNHKYENESYWKTYLLPFRMKEHRKEMGDYQVAESFKYFNEGKYRECLHYLRVGVARSPGNLEGRQLLATFYLRWFQQPEEGLKILKEGIPYAANSQPYLNTYLTLLNKYMKDNEVLELTQKELDKNPKDPLIVKTLVLHRAQALALLVRYDEMEDLLKKYDLTKTQEGTLLMATVLWTRDRRQDAIKMVADTLNETPSQSRGPLYAALTRYLREDGQLEEARRVASRWMLNNSMQIQPRVEYLHLLHAEGDLDYEKQYANATLELFSTEQNALLLLANYATAGGNIELMRRIYERAVENEFDVAPFTLLLIESYVSSGDFSGAIAFIEEIDNEKPVWLTRQKALFDSLRAVAYYGNGDTDLSSLYLNQFLSSKSLRVENLLAIADRMEKMGALEQARRILAQAYADNPENQIVLTRLTSLDLRLGISENLGDHLLALMKMRRPSPKLLVESYRSLGSDRFIFVKNREGLINAILDTIEKSPKAKSIQETLDLDNAML